MDTLQRLADRHDIEQVWVRYFDRVDADDAAAAVADFAEDCTVEIMTGTTYDGRDEYAGVLDRVLRQYAVTSHHLSNVTISYIDDDTVEMRAYVYAYHRLHETGEPWHLFARIVDRMERRDRGWTVVQHTLHGVDSTPRWHRIDDAWYRGHPGRRDRAADADRPRR